MDSHDVERQNRIKAHNDRLLKEISEGYNCTPVSMWHYMYPPRPIIKKDKDALVFIHKKPILELVE